ncbi:Heterokaryon incompatibility protein (HET) domain containing protein [Naviculisporaceae sp. PSN 640]
MNVKCDRCRILSFRKPEGHIPSLGSKLVHILHRTKESWLQSISAGCHLCTLVRGQVYNSLISSPVCDAVGAYVVLAINVWPGVDPAQDQRLTVGIISKLGISSLHRIEDLEDNCSAALTGYISSRLGSLELLGDIKSPIRPRGSTTSFNAQLARMWRDECLDNHSRCQRGAVDDQVKLPTRLLDVTDPNRPLLRESASLIEKEANTQYVALSYCWGLGKRFLTLRSNYESFTTAGISSQDLPRTFRDAVHAANNIGYRFIWIDALCIIQDDRDDLQRELTIMGDIYRYAAMTIGAQGAASSHSGLFESSRHPLSLIPCTVELSITTPSQHTTTFNATLAVKVRSEDNLDRRGWILQEDILTSRALRFSDQMSWRCMESFRTETEPCSLFSTTPSAVDPLRKIRKHICTDTVESIPKDTGGEVAPARSSRFSSWYNMVQLYSDKELSFESDVLRALLGIAAMFRDKYKITYLAGLWKEDLFCGLCWYASANDRRPVAAVGLVSSVPNTSKREIHSAPSWTWAAVGKVRVRFACMAGRSGSMDDDILPRRSRGREREVLDAFCAWDDPINEPRSLERSGRMPGQIWSIRLKTTARSAVLRRSADYTEWRMSRTYATRGSKNTSVFESLKTAQGFYPRFPGQLMDCENDTVVVGEAGLDFAPEVDFTRLQASTTIRDGSRNELVKWDSGTGFGTVGKNSESQYLEVTCLLLDTYQFAEDWFEVCLIVLPRAEGSTSFTRIGLGLLPFGHGQSLRNRPFWKDLDCEIV